MKNKMKLDVLTWGFLMALAAPMSMAEGFYGAVDAGQSKGKDHCISANFLCTYTDTAYRLAVGYQVNRNFGIEGAYVDSGKFSGYVTGLTVDMKSTEWQVAAVGTYPFENNFSLFGKIGVAFWDMATSTSPAVALAGYSPNGRNVLLGAGVQYDFSDRVAVRGQYETHQIGDNVTMRGDLAMLSVGLVFKF